MYDVRLCDDPNEWDELVLGSDGHPLQLWGWGEVKASHGWKARRLVVSHQGRVVGAAQVLIRSLPWPLKALAYVPRGPVVANPDDRLELLDAIAQCIKRDVRAAVITVEPDWLEAAGLRGWRQSSNTILIPRTLILDLSQSEDDLLAKMTKKTRQYIRKSAKSDIEVRQVETNEDIAKCLAIYEETAKRADFAIHDETYYRDVASMLGEHSLITAAYKDGEPVAFLWLAISRSVAFELYGCMNDIGQAERANFTLKWETIRLAKRWGVERYDMNGLLNDGVSKFKQGFANHEDMLVGTYDRPLSPLYFVWDRGLPIAKRLIRWLKRR